MSNEFGDGLGELADPTKYVDDLDINGFEKSQLLNLYSKMVTIRDAEQAIAQLVIDNLAKCPCHLAIGQEAIAVGVSESLNKNDYVFGNHRSHAHYLSLGSDLDALMAEILGKKTGCSGGLGGSMHLISENTGFVGSVPIVAGTIPLAAGAALAAKMHGKNQVAVSYFGDGSTEEGVFHETMNFAKVFNLPILFVCENNLYSSHLDIKLRQPDDSIARYAKAHNMKSELVDGNDVALVTKTASRLIQEMRNGGGPAFIEAVTYRWLGHVGADANIDVGVRRSESEMNAWKNRDPIMRLRNSILKTDAATSEELNKLDSLSDSNVKSAVEKAVEAPYPDQDILMSAVYAEKNYD